MRDVEHVREPRQRIPADLRGRQRPRDVAVQDVLVFVDELAVVVIDERRACATCAENDEGERDEQRGDRPVARSPCHRRRQRSVRNGGDDNRLRRRLRRICFWRAFRPIQKTPAVAGASIVIMVGPSGLEPLTSTVSR